jgi:hypothetical protein
VKCKNLPMRSTKIFVGAVVALLLFSIYACTKEYWMRGEQIEIIDLLPGEDDSCTYGGTKIITWFDDNDNQKIEEKEITDVAYVCNGKPGRDGRVPIFDRVPTTGGQILLIGFDYNNNGDFDEDEVVMKVFIQDGQDGADGADGAAFIFDANRMTFIEECGAGGIIFTYGYDTNGEPGLQEDEVLGTQTLCDGKPGADGSDGADGADGQDGTDGVNCWDLDQDGVNDPEEDTNEDGVWDAKDCRAVESYFVREVITTPPSCENGGIRVDIYDDVDQDGKLDKTIDFFLESVVLCYGQTVADAIAAGDRLMLYFDVDVVITPGNNQCPDAENAETYTIYLEGDVLVKLAKCPIPTTETTN